MYIAKRRLWILPAMALAMLLAVSALLGFSSAAHAQGTVAGDYCVEGIVIDWEEEPMDGITVTLTLPDGTEITDVTDDGSDDPDDEGTFKFEAPDDPVPWAGAPGVYTATVTLPGDDWEGVTPTTFSFEIKPNTDGCVQIRFKLRQIVEVTVYKIDADHTPLPNWTIDAVPGGGNFFAEPQSEDTDGDGAAVFNLTPGVWIFMERQPASDDSSVQPDRSQPILPLSGRMELDVQPLEEGDPAYVIVFKNEFVDAGCISIRKFAVISPTVSITDTIGPDVFGAAGWGFSLERSDGTLARQGVTDAEGYLTWTGLPFGPYTIVEEERAGWSDVSVTAVDVNIESNECVLVPFINEQDDSGYCIEGYKRDVNGGYGIPNWKIETDPVDDGGYEPDDVYTDGLGYYKIEFPGNDYRIPGSEFEVCEDADEMDGWLPVTPLCQIVKLPVKPGHCVQALDFVNEQVGHSQSVMQDEKQKAVAEHMQENAMTMHEPDDKMMGDKGGPEPDGKMMGDMDGGASWQGKDGPEPDGKMMDGGASWPGKEGMHCANVHVVKAGEGLFDIGYDYDVSAQAMVNANPDVKAPDYTIYIGQQICIP